MIF
ncbi:Protein of unknown function [Bacillus mycoides]|jgi:hypothetical protein